MTAPDDARRVAATLTKAQRIMLEQAATNHHVVCVTNEHYRGGIVFCLKPIDHKKYSAFRITPLGLAVRAILIAEDVRYTTPKCP